MRHFRKFHISILGCCVLALALVAVATAQGMKSSDPVADRQRLMKLVGANWADIQAKVKAGSVDAVAVNAETIAVSASHIAPLFPAGSLTDKSKAKPEIWQKWPEFEAAAKNAESLAEQLRDAARAQGPGQGRGHGRGVRAEGLRYLPHALPPAPS